MEFSRGETVEWFVEADPQKAKGQRLALGERAANYLSEVQFAGDYWTR